MFIPPLARWWLAGPYIFLTVFAAAAFIADLAAYLPCILCTIHVGLVLVFLVVVVIYYFAHIAQSDIGLSSGVLLRSLSRGIRYAYVTARGTAVDSEKQYAPVLAVIAAETIIFCVLVASVIVDRVVFGELSCMTLPLVTVACGIGHLVVSVYLLRKRPEVILPDADKDATILPL